MSLRRYGNTDAQEEALGAIEGWANKLSFKLRYGTAIGKSPQHVLLDHEHQDGLVRVNGDGEVYFDGKYLNLEELQRDMEEAIEKYEEAHDPKRGKITVPTKGDKLVGIICGYCGFSRDADGPKQQAKIGCVPHEIWLDVGYETAQKVGKLQLANKHYTLEVCPACTAVIDVIEKKG